jgi:hypothetical protein
MSWRASGSAATGTLGFVHSSRPPGFSTPTHEMTVRLSSVARYQTFAVACQWMASASPGLPLPTLKASRRVWRLLFSSGE